MKHLFFNTHIFFAALLIASCGTDSSKEQKDNSQYQPTWESLKQHQNPDWFLDAKFGIYTTWGPYSVPDFSSEWYSHEMYTRPGNPAYPHWKGVYDHHIKNYGSLDKFGYKDFIPMFKAEKFDAEDWADLFQKAGAQFCGTISEHADGFAMWDSKLTKWDAMDMGPHRDFMGELSKSIRKRDMKFISTYHRAWLFAWYPTWDEGTDCFNPEFTGLYGPKINKGDFQLPPHEHRPLSGYERYPMAPESFNKEWYDRIVEIIDNYKPDLIWLDSKVDVIDENYRKKFLSYYYNAAEKQDREVLVTYKNADFAVGSAVLNLERARMSDTRDFPWLTDTSVDWDSWSHVNPMNYKSTNRIIDEFADIISKNGCLLLNITPKHTGKIPTRVKEMLLEMGEWMKINSEAVYSTRPWKVYGEGPTKVVEGYLNEKVNPEHTTEDIRFTTGDNNLYAFVLDWPGQKLKINSLGIDAGLLTDEIKSVQLLGSSETLSWEKSDDALNISMPEQVGSHAFVLKIELK